MKNEPVILDKDFNNKSISLPVLPESNFGRLQIYSYSDECLVISIIRDKEIDCIVNPDKKAFVGEYIQVGLNKKNSKALREFLRD